MRKSKRYSLLLVAALIVALIVAIVLRKAAPPEAARLLPESDAIVYVNLKPLRLATHFDRTSVNRAPEYQQFVDATGIVPERDLDAAAFALHRMDNPSGPNGPVGYSEVFEGRFDGEKLAHYLDSIATERETYAGHTIYTVAIHDGEITRPLRVAQLGYDSIAASNMPTAEQIHSILDRHRSAASPFSGSSLLSSRYRDVPLLSSAWASVTSASPSDRGYISFFGLQLPLPEDTTFVASLRYTGSLRLRIEEISPTEADAAQAAQKLSMLLGLFKSLQQQVQPRNAEDAAFLRLVGSIKLDQHKERAVVTATVPLELLQSLSSTAVPPASPSPQPESPPAAAH